MQTITIAGFLDDKFEIMEAYSVYVIRDGDLVFYVGQSDDVVNRLYDHLGDGPYSADPSSIGRLIIDNVPASLQ
jgi:hypothetical protein